MPRMLTTTWAGEELLVLPHRALYWPRKNTLFIADAHFGKASAFRSSGIPIPPGTTASDLCRLDDALLQQPDVRRLVVLGDFFHHASGRCDHTMNQLSEWRRRWSQLEILLIRGNHDDHSGDPPSEWNFEVVDGPCPDGPFLLCHEPCAHEGGHVLGGHIHPGINLRDASGASLRLPCFLFGAGVAMLPAFGGFTGLATVRPVRGDLVFVSTESEVFLVPT